MASLFKMLSTGYGRRRRRVSAVSGISAWKSQSFIVAHIRRYTDINSRYEKYERVDMGDFNWLTPNFVAFASPQCRPVTPIPTTSPLYATLPSTVEAVENSKLPGPFKNVLSHFSQRDVGLVVRLNSELYSPSYFSALGINHLDMIFDDGTCPPLSLVKKFIKLAHETITVKHKNIAVHCKAGLGRTGCLIGAYLIYRHGFTANEIIAFMRFMRPGMVVGPQQHWLHLNQGTFREWWWEDIMKEKLALILPTTPTKSSSHRQRMMANGQTATPPNGSQQGKRSALGEINHNESNVTSSIDECLPAPTPGQPRKTSRMNSPVRAYARAQSGSYGVDQGEKPANEIIEMRSHRQSQGQGDDESEEEWQLRLLSRRTSSKSPASSDKKRAISYTTTTTTSTRYSTVGDEVSENIMSDVENWTQDVQMGDKVSRPKTPGSTKSGSGSGTLGVSKVRGSPVRRSADSREAKAAGIRKSSGRVGSIGATAAARSKS